ncbi:hypothetical protein BH11PLA1_BH11PLA1_07760 [soil metagenome]
MPSETSSRRPSPRRSSSRPPRHPRGGVRLSALVVIVLGLLASIVLTARIASSAGANQLTYTDRAEEGMSGNETFAVAAGAFRGLFVNLLWMRANDLKEAGKFHEAVDLARTITRLQPRFPRVWAFHAWNLAYNISVATNTPQERWQWVNSGIRLLRDEGIPQNPSDLLLHKELAWLFLHKVSGTMDDANQFYKRQFALEWTVALGTPPEPSDSTRTTDAAIKAYSDPGPEGYIGKVAGAANSLDEVYAAEPAARALVATLKDKYQIDVTSATGRKTLLSLIEGLRSAVRQIQAMSKVNPAFQSQYPQGDIIALLTDDANIPARRAVINTIRKRILIDEYHMEPERMLRYTAKYGPLDWRVPAAHAVYWAARGVEESLARLNDRNAKSMDFINTDRMVVQALQEMFRSGQLIFDFNSPDLYVTLPNDYFISTYGRVIKEFMDREVVQYKTQKDADIRGRTYNFYAAGYENFLHDAITFLYRRGQIEEAEKYRQELIHWAGAAQNTADFSQALWKTQPLEDFVINNVKGRITSPNIAVQEVAGSVQTALINGLLRGNMDVYRQNMKYAETFHKTYTAEQWRTSGVDTNTARMGVMGKDFRVLTGFYTAYTMKLSGLTNAQTIWVRMPVDQQLYTYANLRDLSMPQNLTPEQSAEAVKAFEQLYPKPIGYDAFAAQMATKLKIEAERGQGELK